MTKRFITIGMLLLFVPSCVSVRSQRIEAMTWTIRAETTADLIQTVPCLQSGHCREANPVVRPLENNPFLLSVVGGGLTELSLWGLRRMSTKSESAETWTFWSMVGIAAVKGFVLWHNQKVLNEREQ